MKLPKFIITMDSVFRLGMVDQHKHLLKPGDQCIGGGYYTFDFVPSTYRGLRIVYKYDDGFHDDFNVSEELKIEYYD